MLFFPIRKQLEFACKKCSDFAPTYYPIQRALFRFSSRDLIDFVRKNPNACQKILLMSDDKRYSPSTFIMPTQKNYLVGLSPHNIQYVKQIQSFDNIDEAIADYVLLNWKLPRLRPAQTEKTLKCPDFITFFDEDGNVFDKRHGRFKYYDQTKKTFVYYD